MSDRQALPGMESLVDGEDWAAEDRAANAAAPRLRCADRRQIRMEASCLDDLLAADHRARLVWSVVQRLDLSFFLEEIVARAERRWIRGIERTIALRATRTAADVAQVVSALKAVHSEGTSMSSEAG